MNKKELISEVADQTGLTKKDVEQIFTSIFNTIKDTLGRGDRIAIKGFGSFSTKRRAAKTGRHPKTGEELKIPARTVPAFSAGSDLKDVVANPRKRRKKPAKKAPAKKTTARKSTAKKTTTRKSTAKKTTARKSTAKKTTAKKTTRKSPAKKTTTRKKTTRKR